MTERLSSLLHDEATDLDIPVPDNAAVLRQGRGLRRRRRAGVAITACAAVAVLSFGAAGLAGVLDTTVTDAPAAAGAPAASGLSGAFAVGSQVYPAGAAGPATTVDGQVKSVYYTSAGVVARVGNLPYSIDEGPSRYVLITADRPRDLGIDLGERVPGTDAAQPYLAWAEKSGDGWDVVVLDVRDATEAARVHLSDAFTWAGWEGPPVALSGSSVYVGLDEHTAVVDWQTGAVTESSILPGGQSPAVVAGRAVVMDENSRDLEVVDLASGEALLSLPGRDVPWVSLSPDGRYAQVYSQAGIEREQFDVHELDTGRAHTFEQAAWDFGWTPDGDLLRVADGTASVCPPLGGDCTSTPIQLPDGELRLGGNLYES